jgi:hypothetical protein
MATKLTAISERDYRDYRKLYQFFQHDEYNFSKITT